MADHFAVAAMHGAYPAAHHEFYHSPVHGAYDDFTADHHFDGTRDYYDSYHGDHALPHDYDHGYSTYAHHYDGYDSHHDYSPHGYAHHYADNEIKEADDDASPGVTINIDGPVILSEGAPDLATLLAEALEIIPKQSEAGADLLSLQGYGYPSGGPPRRTQSWSPGMDYSNPPGEMSTKQKVHASAKKWGGRFGNVGMGATAASMVPGVHVPGTAVTAAGSYIASGICKGIECATGNRSRPSASQAGGMAGGVAQAAGAIPHPVPQAIAGAAQAGSYAATAAQAP